MPIFSTKDAQGNMTLNVIMGAGISTISQGMPVVLTLLDGFFGIRERFSQKANITLMCSQITSIQEIHDMELISKNRVGSRIEKNPKPPGRIPGLVEGIRTKKGMKFKEFIVINYGSTNKKVMVFEKVTGTTIGSDEFIKEVQERANITA